MYTVIVFCEALTKERLSCPVPAKKAQRGSGGTALPSLNFSARWTQVVNVTFQPFWPWKRHLMH